MFYQEHEPGREVTRRSALEPIKIVIAAIEISVMMLVVVKQNGIN